MVPIENRRSQPRHALSRPCKVFHSPTGRYLAGCTSDVSRTGALLDVRCPRTLRPGDEIGVYIAWSDKGLLTEPDAVAATVRRVLALNDGRQMVGVEFARALAHQPLAAAA